MTSPYYVREKETGNMYMVDPVIDSHSSKKGWMFEAVFKLININSGDALYFIKQDDLNKKYEPMQFNYSDAQWEPM